jgi:hypothetical protein
MADERHDRRSDEEPCRLRVGGPRERIHEHDECERADPRRDCEHEPPQLLTFLAASPPVSDDDPPDPDEEDRQPHDPRSLRGLRGRDVRGVVDLESRRDLHPSEQEDLRQREEDGEGEAGSPDPSPRGRDQPAAREQQEQ